MARMLGVALAAGLLAAPAAATAVDATATLSDSSPGARHVGLTIVLRAAELQCGRLNARSLSVTLPRAMRVPPSIRPDAARVDGRPATSARVEGTTIVLVPARAKAMICDSIGPGIVRIQLGRTARLGNPARVGTYGFTVQAEPNGDSWQGSFVVR